MAIDSSVWHNGLDNYPYDLADKVQKLMHDEAAKFHLTLKSTESGFGLFTTRALREGEAICDVTALWYNTKEALKHILSQEGNKILLDKLLTLDGLYNGEEAMTVFGIRVGCAAFARHYVGVRKGGPNAKIIVNSGAGFTSQLTQMVVSTRNNLGIGQDMEICVNYGTSYDFGVIQETSESPYKKFKGQLEALFEKQASSTTEGKNNESDIKNEKDAKKPKEATEEEKKDEPAAKKPRCGDPAPEKSVGKESLPAGTMAKDVTPEGFTLKFVDGHLSLHANTNATGNKKCPPGSVLYLIRDGKMKKVEGPGSEPYKLDPKKMVMVAPTDKAAIMGKPQTLKEVIEQLNIKVINEVPEFVAPGQCPAKLDTKFQYHFVPEDCMGS